MAQELTDKIRAAAQARGIDPDTALAIAKAESSLRPNATPGTSSAGGLFQVVDKTWKEFGGKPGKKFDPDENIRVGTDIIAKNTQTLKSFLQRDPRPAEIYAAHYFGAHGAKSFLTAEPNTPMESLFPAKVIKANPNLKGKTSGQVLASLETKMGSAPAVSRETPAPVTREPLPPSLPPMAAAPAAAAVAAAPTGSKMASLGPSYQAALALSFLADTDDKEDRDIDREPGVAEKWLAQMDAAPRPAALAEFADVKIRSPFAEPQQPIKMAEGGDAGGEESPEVARPTAKEARLAKAFFPDLPAAEAVYMLRGGNRQNTLQGEMLSGNIGARIPLDKDTEAMLMLAGSRPEGNQSSSKALLAALNQRMGEGNVGATLVRPVDAPPGFYAGDMSASYPLGQGRISGSVNAMRFPGGQTEVTGYGVGYGGRVGPGNLSVGISRQANNGPYSGQVEYRLPIGRAEGGQVELPIYDVKGNRTIINDDSGNDPSVESNPGWSGLTPGEQAAYFQDPQNAVHAGLRGLAQGLWGYTTLGLVQNFLNPSIQPAQAAITRGETPQQTFRDSELGKQAAVNAAYEAGRVTTNEEGNLVSTDTGAPASRGGETSSQSGVGNPGESDSDGGGFSDTSNMAANGGLITRNGVVRRSEGSPQAGERASTQQEIDAASTPAFIAQKSGIGREKGNISRQLQSGEAYTNFGRGLTEMPYNIAGAPMDLAMMIRQGLTGQAPAGQVGTSEYIKNKMTELGIRQKPPTDPTSKGFYAAGDLLSNLVNPASVPRAAARGASAVGKTAAEMLKSDPALPLLVARAPAQEVSRVMPPVETPRSAPIAAAPQIRQVEPPVAPVQQAEALPAPPAEVNVPAEMVLPPVSAPVAPPMQAGVPADRPFVGRLDSFIDTLGGPVQLGQLKGQLKGKFRDYDLERVERAFPGMDAKTKLTPDQIKQALSETYSPSKYVSETLPPKEGKYHQYADNVWKAPLGTTNLYLDQAPEALEANALLKKAVQVFSPFLKTQTSSAPTLENLTQARALLASPEILRTVDPGLVTNLSKTFDKVEKNVGLVNKYSDVIKNVSNGFSSPVLYVDDAALLGGKYTTGNQPFFKFAEEAMNAERAALEQKFLAQGLDLRTANSRVHDEIMSNYSLFYINSKKIAAQKVQALAIAEAQKNGIDLPDVSLIKWDELSDVSFPGGSPAFKQSLENALEPSRVTVNNALLNIKNVMDPEIKKVGDILYQRGNLYEGKHSAVAGKPYPIGFTRFSEHESTIPGMGAVQGRHFHELQSDLSKDMRKFGTTSGSAAKDQAEYNKLRGEVQQAEQKAMGKLEKLEAQKQALIQSGESNPANIKNIDEEFTSVRVALEKETRAAEKRISILGGRVRGKTPYSLEEPFAGFETNQMVRQQLLMKNAIQSAMRDGKGFATFPGAESNQPKLYVDKVRPNLKQVIKDLGGEKSGLELRQIELPPDKDGRPITATGVVWSPEAAARIVKTGVPFAKGGMVERQSTDNRRYL